MVFRLENYIGNEYLRALVILVVFFIVLRVVVFIIEKIILRLTSKTRTDIDDRFVAKTSKPVSALILLIGLRIAIEELSVLGDYIDMAGSVLYSVMIIAGGFLLYYFIDIVLFVVLKKAMKGESTAVRKSLFSLIHSMLIFIIIALIFLYILEVWGVEIGPFLAGLGILGIAIALALQPALANIFSGVSVILDKSVKVGDLIYLDKETGGRVKRVGLRSTKILTFDNEIVIVPNTKIADSNIQNVGEPDPKARVVIPFGVAYGTNIDKVRKTVMKEIKTVKGFVNDPEPIVRFLEMGNSSLNFKAYFHVETYEMRYAAVDEANTKIYNALNKAKIEIPFPQMDVHVKKS